MAKRFDKAEWLEAKEQKLSDAKAALEEGLKKLQTSQDWQDMLKAMAHAGALSVGRYSFSNQLLIACRRPGTSRAATFKTWLEHGRHVKKGESGIPILAPVFARRQGARDQVNGVSAAEGTFTSPLSPDTLSEGSGASRLVAFKVISVFGLDQTDGEPLPEPPHFDFDAPEPFANCIEKLTQVALALPGSPVSRVTLRERMHGDHSTALGWYELNTRAIVVITGERVGGLTSPAPRAPGISLRTGKAGSSASGDTLLPSREGGDPRPFAPRSRAQQFKTLVHECTHALLHPLNAERSTLNGLHNPRSRAEVEAESVAFVVCHALGVDSGDYSVPYVAGWAQGDDALTLVADSGERIAKTSRTILDALTDTSVSGTTDSQEAA
jgi:antirestriction protein ArdC